MQIELTPIVFTPPLFLVIDVVMEAANNGDAEAQLDDDGHDGIPAGKAAHQDTDNCWWPDHFPHEADCEGLAAAA